MKQLKKVYLLHFVYEFKDGHDDVILLGIFSSKIKAEKALSRLRSKVKLAAEHFVIDENVIDRMSWEEGFVTVE